MSVDFENMTSDQRQRFTELIDRAAQIIPEIEEMYDYGIISLYGFSGRVQLSDEAMRIAFPDAVVAEDRLIANHNGVRFIAVI